jgi:hypothetical protein
MNDKTTCQICEREVKQPHGLTSHHGYSRPGYGWQTASCPGARELPYEESCDLIPPVIKSIENFKAMKQAQRDTYMTKPPKVLTKTHKNIYSGQETTEEFDRPDDFDSYAIIDRDEPFSYYDDYRKYFKQAIYNIDREVKGCNEDIKRLQARVDNWVKVR